MTLTPRPYQTQAIQDIRAAFKAGARRVCFVLATGGGKTIISSLIGSGLHGNGKKAIYLGHRTEIVFQLGAALRKVAVPFSYLTAATIGMPRANILVASMSTLHKRKQRISFEPDLLFVDECFPSSTLIDGRAISELACGDYIFSFCHHTDRVVRRRVKRTFRQSAPKIMMRVRFASGKEIVCTPSHPIFTGDGYIPAGLLCDTDMVLTTMEGQDVHTGLGNLSLVLKNIYDNNEARKCSRENEAQGLLLERVRQIISDKNFIGNHGAHQSEICVRAYDKPQSDAPRRNTGESKNEIAGHGMGAASSRWQWEGPDASSISFGIDAWMGNRGGHSYPHPARERLSDLLQVGHSQQGAQDWRGSGRLLSHFSSASSAGPEEGQFFCWDWVDRVEVHERGSTFGPDKVCPDGHVYNLEVEETHNYFANGVLVHNCHHSRSRTWEEVIHHFPKAKVVGLTATPCRLDGKGLGDVFDTLVEGPDTAELIADGFLSDFQVYAPKPPNLTGVHMRAGDYVAAELDQAMRKAAITGDAVKHYTRLAAGKSAVVFCVSVAHAEEVAEQFRRAGYKFQSIDGKMSAEQRQALIADMTAGRIHGLTSCDIISEGTDIPRIEVVVMLRPTKSFGLYRQMAGRGLRLFDGKDKLLILDHAGNTLVHGMIDEPVEWSLAGGAKRAESGERSVALRNCPKCLSVHKAAPECPRCGHVYLVKSRVIEQVDGDLELMVRGSHSRTGKSKGYWDAAYEALKAVEKAKGYKRGWAERVLAGRQEAERQRMARALEMGVKAG